MKELKKKNFIDAVFDLSGVLETLIIDHYRKDIHEDAAFDQAKEIYDRHREAIREAIRKSKYN